MEHLFSWPENTSDYPLVTIKAIPNPNILEYKKNDRTECVSFFEPKTPYLGFHVARSTTAASKLSDYPSVRGVDIEKLWNGDLRGSSQELEGKSGEEVSFYVASFLQAWLYFGLLESVLGTRVDDSYLVRSHTDRRPFLYSRGLLCCLHNEVFKHLSEEERELVGWNIVNELDFTRKWIGRLVTWGYSTMRDRYDREFPLLTTFLDCILPSIVRLAEAIDMARVLNFGDHEATLWGVRSWPYPFRKQEEQATELQKLGWCEFQIEYMYNTVNRSTMDWMIAIRLNQDPAGHETCTKTQCDRNNVDSSTYEQSHVTKDCLCSALKPDVQQVIQILKNHGIPIIVLHESHEEIKLSIMNSTTMEPTGYLAISHVWADGLGGSTETGLLQCQARRLLKLLSPFKSFSVSSHFWLDTLCIPRSDPDAYMAALIGIRTVYLNAKVVVVLDRMIETCSDGDPWVLLFARIHLSPWVQRMWTYEEAVLAKRLAFVLKDGKSLWFDEGETWPKFGDALKVVYRSLGRNLITLRSVNTDIGTIQNAFRYRLTNARNEEFLSVAGILGLDTTELLKVHGEARTCRFWVLLKHVPLLAPFHDGPKLSVPGFRWAPSTLMSIASQSIRGVPGIEAECTTEGLIGSYGMIRHETLPFSQGFFTIVFGGDPHIVGDEPQEITLMCQDRKNQFQQLNENNVLGFDHIIFIGPNQGMPKPGSTGIGIGVLKLDQTVPDTAIKKYQWIGRIQYEGRARDRAGTFDEPNIPQANKSVDALGHWVIEKICLT